MDDKKTKLLNVLLGGAIGDSFLLPYEFLKKHKSHKKFQVKGFNQSLFLNYGLTSDDTDHAILTYQSLVETQNLNKELFQKKLANKIKIWFLLLPIGIGLTTIKAILKLLIGFSPNKSGINSLGNGPLMRMPIIATWFDNDESNRNQYLKLSTEITHNNKEAMKITELIGNVIAFISCNQRKPTKEELIILLRSKGYPLTEKFIKILMENIDADLNVFLKNIDSQLGVSGYIMTSGIFILYIIQNTKSYKEAFKMIINASGDTDTIGAIIGSTYALLDKSIINDKELNKIGLFNIKNIQKTNYFSLLIKNLIEIPIVLIHAMLRYIK